MKLNIDIAQRIIDRYVAGESSSDLAVCFQVSRATVSHLLKGRTWKECSRPNNMNELLASRYHLFESGSNSYWNKAYGYNQTQFTERQWDIVIGSLLGDGHFSFPPHASNCKFVKSQCLRFKEYIEWHNQELVPYSLGIYPIYSNTKIVHENNKIVYISCDKRLCGFGVYTCSHPIFTDIYEQWYKGKKTIPDSLVLNPLRLAVWYCDDGSTYAKQRKTTFCTDGFALRDVEFLASLFPAMGLRAGITKFERAGNKYHRLILTGDSYDAFFDLVKSYIPWGCFRYKLEHRKRA